MTDVIDLSKAREEKRLIWTCSCGCTTHYHYADGGVACGSCDTPANGNSGEWRLRIPDPPSDPADLDASNFKVTSIATADVFLRRQIKLAAERGVAAAVVAYDDGALSTWAPDIEGDERKAWVRRKLAEASARIAPE